MGTSLIRFPYHYFWSLIKSGGEPDKYMAHLLLLRLTYLEILCWLLQDTGEEGRKAARKRRLQHRSKQQQQPLLPLILPLYFIHFVQTTTLRLWTVSLHWIPMFLFASHSSSRQTPAECLELVSALHWDGRAEKQSSSTSSSSRAGLKQHRQRGRAVKLVRPTPPLVFVSNFLAIHNFQASVSIHHSTHHITADFANVTFLKLLIFLLLLLAYFKKWISFLALSTELSNWNRICNLTTN